MHWLHFRVAMALCCLWVTAASAEKRVALVIGNSKYIYAGELANPVNDANDMKVALGKLGFTVIDGYDLQRAALEKKIREFAGQLQGADVGVFFYAGHGLQVSGVNYIVPVDAELTTAEALDFEMVRLDSVQRIMERTAKTNILFLDACRNNPLTRNLARAMGTRSAEIGPGLAPAESGIGTLISFSTQPGNVARDGSGRNSPFTGPLLQRIATPGEDILSVLTAVRRDVLAATNNSQVPWENHALVAKFYFNASKAPAAEEPESAALHVPLNAKPVISAESERTAAAIAASLKAPLNDYLSKLQEVNWQTGTFASNETVVRFINALNKTFSDLQSVKIEQGEFFEELKKCTAYEKSTIYHFFVVQLAFLMFNSNFDNGGYTDFNKGIYEQSYYLQNDHARKLIVSRLSADEYSKIAIAVLYNLYRNKDTRAHFKAIAQVLLNYDKSKTKPVPCFDDFSYSYIGKSKIFSEGTAQFTMSPGKYVQSFWERRKNEHSTQLVRAILAILATQL